MKTRLVASAALSALVVLGATGCTFITHQATTIPYSPSDGVNVTDSEGPLLIRNALIITNEDGSLANLVAAVVNPTDDDATLTVEAEGIPALTVDVEAGETVSLGANADPLALYIPTSEADLEPGTYLAGSTLKVYFQSGDATGETAEVPVLDGALPYYADLEPKMPIWSAEEDDNFATPAPSN